MSNFAFISETPGLGASPSQYSELFNRYHFVAERAAGKDVLEVACGAGFGLGYIARKARSIYGGDYDPEMVRIAKAHYGDRISIEQMDAQELPFADASFDIVTILEALYYVPDAGRFFAEASRVLRPGGELIMISANREWTAFNKSPNSTHYHIAREFYSILPEYGFTVRIFKAYPDNRSGMKQAVFGLLRKAAVTFDLIPKNKWGKEKIKKLLYGKLIPLPSEVCDGMAPIEALHPVAEGESVVDHTILYVVATKTA